MLGPEGIGDSGEGPTTAEYLQAIGGTRATVSRQSAVEFAEDIERLARP